MHAGQVIQSRFELEQRVAAGGMGQIFRAKDLATGHCVALKVMHTEEFSHTQRFIREATVLSELHHPCIVEYVAHGRTESDKPYLAMEWLEGEDLARRLQRGPLEMDETLLLVENVANAMAVAHTRDIVHRDLKPSNLFLVGGNVALVKVLDFGIATMSSAARLTRSGAPVGTPSYMAPEQIRSNASERLDVRADVFALGCILMECLTGVRVFQGEHPLAIMVKIVMEEPPRPSELCPGIPEDLDVLIQKMLAKDRNNRPRDGAAVASALREIRAHHLPRGMTSTFAPPVHLTDEEQRILSILLIDRPPTVGDDPTIPSADENDAEQAMRSTVERLGGTWNLFPDGSVLVTMTEIQDALDPTVQLATCSLALKPWASHRIFALTTGRGKTNGASFVGAVIDRAVNLVTTCNTDDFRSCIVLDETSAHLLDGRFDIGRVDAQYTLHSSKNIGLRTLLGKPTAFVGRDPELKTLERHWKKCIEEHVATATLVLGPAGMGKSRMLLEFLHSIRRQTPETEIWMGRGNLLAVGSALAMLANMLRDVFGLHEGMTLDERQQRIENRVTKHPSAATDCRTAEFLGELIGVPFSDVASPPLQAARRDPRLMSERLLQGFLDFLDKETTCHPVLLVLDDLQWGDRPTVRFIDTALRNLTNRSLFILALARPEVEDVFPMLWSDRSFNLIRLRPLSKKASERLVAQAFSKTMDPRLLARIVAQADGNAFYLEELVRAVADGANTKFPETVLAMVQSRIEALSSEARRCLRAASVFGEVFHQGGLATLVGMKSQTPAFTSALDELVERELIQRQDGSQFIREVQYVFRHALVRESAYAMLTDSDRQLGHRLAGTWLDAHGESDAMVLAHHFERSDEPLRAVGAYHRAAEQALGADDIGAAIDRAERSVLRGAAGEQLGALRLIQAEAHNWHGELVQAEQRAMEAVSLLVPSTERWFRAYQQAFDVAGKQGAVERIESWSEQVMRSKPTVAVVEARTTCLSVCAIHLIYGGRYDAADVIIAHLQELLAAQAPPPQILGMWQELLAIRASASGDACVARKHLQASIHCFDQVDDRRHACVARQNLGFILIELGDYGAAEQVLRAALAVGERMGLHEAVAYTLVNLGLALGYLGAFEEGRQTQTRAIAAAQKYHHPRLEGLAYVYLAILDRLSGDAVTSEKHAQAALTSLSDVPTSLALAYAVFARALLMQGRIVEALIAAREAYALLESLGTIEEGEVTVRLVYAEAVAASGDHALAASLLMQARTHVLAKAAKIDDEAERERFLTVIADNAQTLALAASCESDGCQDIYRIPNR